jgi:ASC-1-like (ASCH) protein
VPNLPLFRTKKEAFEWLTSGKKTIDVRKGKPYCGEVAVYLSGRKVLRMKVIERESGRLEEVLRSDNYQSVIPTALTVDEALSYLRKLYKGCEGVFTAYYVEPLDC